MGFSFSTPLLRYWGSACLAGLEKKWVLVLSLLTLKQGPLFDCSFFLLALLLGMGEFEPSCTGSPSEEPEVRFALL